MPDTLSGKLKVWRFIIYRRIVQFTVLLLFLGSVHWGWSVFDKPLLVGTLSSSEFLGVIPMADPFAVLQMFFTGHVLNAEVVIGALIILGFYAILGGRTFCSWVCPINPVTDLAAWLRKRLGFGPACNLNRNTRMIVLALALVLSAITGVAAFEWISPISMLHRELIFGIGLGLTAVLGIFLFDLFIVRNGWCGHICPLGAFYSVVGRVAGLLQVHFDGPTCTHCGECAKVCPEPQVLNLKKAAATGRVEPGDCTNCGRCIPVCPEDTLHFDWRPLLKNKTQTTEATDRRAA
ncbi:MAG: quinol dehydrogenase ferredoxin subunit NapH [Chromatiales bacterium]|nr:quinol dehydrogenase ferredoxin subunit NapH [Chromatiales bacterium]